jgi:hypothetical protein
VIDLLTKQDLFILTNKRQGRCMVRWLADREWVFEIGDDGYPRVDRRYYDMRMFKDGLPEPIDQQPNIQVLRASRAAKA